MINELDTVAINKLNNLAINKLDTVGYSQVQLTLAINELDSVAISKLNKLSIKSRINMCVCVHAYNYIHIQEYIHTYIQS